MHAALGFLLILTVHRCYPAGVPRCLQGNLIRRQIRHHFQTGCCIWIFAILINLPLFSITKYDRNALDASENSSNGSQTTVQPTCETEATEIWSRTYLILLLVLNYLITGIFLIVIYGQAIRIILVSKKYTHQSSLKNSGAGEDSRFLSRNTINKPEQFRTMLARSSTTSSSTNTSTRRQQIHATGTSLVITSRDNQCSTNSHSTQHLQVIIMLFIVILLYILLLLPYRLLNLLYIVHNQLFQQHFMNEILFQCLVNTVRLLVFLNCALQPLTYVIISSRLRQTVMKFLRSCWYKFYCRCHCALDDKTEEHFQSDTRAVQAYLSQKYPSAHRFQPQPNKRPVLFRDNHPSVNNMHAPAYQPFTVVRPAILPSHLTNKGTYTVTFTNTTRKWLMSVLLLFLCTNKSRLLHWMEASLSQEHSHANQTSVDICLLAKSCLLRRVICRSGDEGRHEEIIKFSLESSMTSTVGSQWSTTNIAHCCSWGCRKKNPDLNMSSQIPSHPENIVNEKESKLILVSQR